MEAIAIILKATTFGGVVLSSGGMNLPSVRPVWQLRLFALGLTGVALMVVNEHLAAWPVALVLDAAYALACIAAVFASQRRAPDRPTEHPGDAPVGGRVSERAPTKRREPTP